MNHNAFIHTSLWPYVKNILKIFKNYPELQKKIRIMYREEARKLSEFNTINTSEQRNKYEEIIGIFTKFSKKYIKQKELENLTRPMPNSPRSKVMSKYNNSKTKHNNNYGLKLQRSLARTSKNKENLLKLIKKNWNE